MVTTVGANTRVIGINGNFDDAQSAVKRMFNDREMEDLISSSTAEQVIEKLQKKYHRYVKNVKFTSIEHYTGMIRYHMNYHFMELSTEPKLVLLSYLLLSRIEIQNVVNIIEGVSYGIGIDHIKPMLVY